MSKANCHSGLFTDLYELTMAAAYFENKFTPQASFELFVRSLPAQRGYLVAAGLEQAIDFLESVHFSGADIDFLRQQSNFRHISADFFEYLRGFRFTGEVWAVPEGTPMFGEEPLLRVTAPIIEAQIVETFLLSTITFQTMIASKAARVVEAAKGRSVVEFGSRRAHGPEAGTLAARAAYIAGCSGTSNVEAGQRFGVPVFGTMAHSFVMAYSDEEESFKRFQQMFPEHTVLLVDTYDTMEAIEKIIDARLRPQAVRLDSGDLVKMSQAVRSRLDSAGLSATQIFASSDLDEFVITDLLARGAKIDAFGVGTSMATSHDAPALGGVYKLVSVDAGGSPSYRAKLSGDKVTYPGTKQVFRFRGQNGIYKEDVIGRQSEKYADADPLLECVMTNGTRSQSLPNAQQARERTRQELGKIPAEVRRLHKPEPFSVRFSGELQKLLEEFRNRMAQRGSKVAPGSS